jgi:phosphonate transport system substrate-binding protein
MEASDTLPKHKPFRPALLLLVAIIAAGLIGLGFWIQYTRATVQPDTSALSLRAAGFTNSPPHTLDPPFKDLNGDLIADAPTKASDFIDPATLVFCFVASDDAEVNKANWKPFMDYLSRQTGKPVDYLMVTSTHDQIKAMHDGQLHVAVFNTGGVPPAVNTAGFVPVCALPAPDGGGFTHTDIIVPSDSSLQAPGDLKGHELTLTSPESNSGYKAPLALLRSNFGLQPMTDFRLRCSLSHNTSIAGVVDHKYEAAAVADDMLNRQLATGPLTASQFRIIYKSENFPTAGLGYVYNLKPELAKKVSDALLTFDCRGTPLEKVLNIGTQSKFVPLDYKKDWSLVRRVDDAVGLMSGF